MSSKWMSPVKMMAKQVLFDYKVSDCPARHFTEILKGENIEMVYLNVDDDSCGMYCIESKRRKIYINANMNTGRENFTIAHELGHHFLNHNLNEFCQLFRCDIRNMAHGKDPQEVEANYFAACFLMPYDMVLRAFNATMKEFGRKVDTAIIVDNLPQSIRLLKRIIDICQTEFCVSKETAFYRLKDLKLLNVKADFYIENLYF